MRKMETDRYVKFYDQVSGIVIATGILLSALSWRDVMIAYIDRHPEYRCKQPWIYGAFVTIITLLVIVLITFPLRNIVTKSGGINE